MFQLCPAPSPSPVSSRFSALSLVSDFPSWQQFWGRDRPRSFRLFSDPGLALTPFAPSQPARVQSVLPGTSQLPPECSVPEPPPLAWLLPRRAPSIQEGTEHRPGGHLSPWCLPAAVGSGFSPSATPGSQFSSKSPCQQPEETRKCSETASGSTVPSRALCSPQRLLQVPGALLAPGAGAAGVKGGLWDHPACTSSPGAARGGAVFPALSPLCPVPPCRYARRLERSPLCAHHVGRWHKPSAFHF